jgi:outer membrane protein OmpA-like peptidoglycan-associated protein
MTKLLSSWRQIAAICSLALLAACASHAQQPAQQAAVAAPAATPTTPMHPSQFQIRFDSNKYDITPEGQQTIEAVAKWFQDEDASFITLVGHTDTAGSAATNTELARRRAFAVHDALMATGKIPAGRIEAAWAGEEEQAVQTPNAVAEARNRVVNIYIDYNKPLP